MKLLELLNKANEASIVWRESFAREEYVPAGDVLADAVDALTGHLMAQIEDLIAWHDEQQPVEEAVGPVTPERVREVADRFAAVRRREVAARAAARDTAIAAVDAAVISEAEAARLLGIDRGTMRAWRGKDDKKKLPG